MADLSTLDLQQSLYARSFTNFSPSIAQKVIKQKTQSNEALLDFFARYFKERRLIEEQYAKSLQSLHRWHPHDELQHMSTLNKAWEKTKASSTGLAQSHLGFANQIYQLLETPLHDFASENAELEQLRKIELNIVTIAAKTEEARKRIAKYRKKPKKEQSNKVNQEEQILEELQNTWVSEAPFIYERFELADQSWMDFLKDTIIRGVTLELSQINDKLGIYEGLLNALLSLDFRLDSMQYARARTEEHRNSSTIPPQPSNSVSQLRKQSFADDHSLKSEKSKNRQSRFGSLIWKRGRQGKGGSMHSLPDHAEDTSSAGSLSHEHGVQQTIELSKPYASVGNYRTIGSSLKNEDNQLQAIHKNLEHPNTEYSFPNDAAASGKKDTYNEKHDKGNEFTVSIINTEDDVSIAPSIIVLANGNCGKPLDCEFRPPVSKPNISPSEAEAAFTVVVKNQDVAVSSPISSTAFETVSSTSKSEQIVSRRGRIKKDNEADGGKSSIENSAKYSEYFSDLPQKQPAKLSYSIVEGISVKIKDGDPREFSVLGEVTLQNNGKTEASGKLQISQLNDLNIASPNKSVLKSTEEGNYEFSLSAAAHSVILRYQWQPKTDILTLTPLLIHTLAKHDGTRSNIMIKYSLNASFTDVPIDFQTLKILLHIDDSAEIISCQSKPASVISHDKKVVVWKITEDLILHPGQQRQLLTRLTTSIQAAVSHISLSFGFKDKKCLSGFKLSLLNAESNDLYTGNPFDGQANLVKQVHFDESEFHILSNSYICQ